MKPSSSKIVIGAVLTFSFLSMVVVTAILALSQIKVESQNNILKSLQTVNQTTQEALQIWINYLTTDLIDLAYEKEIIDLTQEIVTKNLNHKNIVTSVPLIQLRSTLSKKLRKHTLNGFTLISNNRINIASLHDEDIGNLSNIHKQRKKYLDRVFAGKTLFIPTSHADTPLKNLKGVYLNNLPTIYIATPVFNSSGNVIAVLAILIDPSKDFTRIIQLGRIGDSGETYAFDDRGILISESRFDYQLRHMGFLKESEKGILSIRISDPGGDMTKGFIPSMPAEQSPLTVMAKSAIAKNTSYNIDGYRDYRGVKVLGVWTWNERFGFGITTEINADEAMRPYNKTRVIIITVLSLVILFLVSFLIILIWLNKKNKLHLD